MVPLEEALQRLVDLAKPIPPRSMPIRACDGLVLAQDCHAQRTQPPFNVSAMDGYALTKHPKDGGRFQVVGEVPAGGAFEGTLADDQAVRIFTGAAVPKDATHVIIQEDVELDASTSAITIPPDTSAGANIREAGIDFKQGDLLLPAGTKLTPQSLGLLAAGNWADLLVHPKPTVAILMTGDELTWPGAKATDDAIIASNGFAIAALLERLGSNVIDIALKPDDLEAISNWIDTNTADLIITIGGASVGDYDLVRPALQAANFEIDVPKVALRPGKPTLFAKRGHQIALGLPGNPVSSIVSALIFTKPLLAKLSGSPANPLFDFDDATLATDLPDNGPRAHFMRANQAPDGNVEPVNSQDSSLLSRLTGANVLLYRPVNAPAANAGEACKVLRLPT